jgi:hypothetical protein
MPKARRERKERTDNYHLLLQWCRTPEQRLYEGIHPITLFGVPPAERAQETGLAESSLRRAADAFDTQGMISLFRPTKAQREDHHRSLPVAMRQLIVDLKAEYARVMKRSSSQRSVAVRCFDYMPKAGVFRRLLAIWMYRVQRFT